MAFAQTRRTPAAGETGVRQEHADESVTAEGTGVPSLPWVTYRVPLHLADDAEQSLAACATWSRAAALMAIERVTMFDFADQRCWEIIVAGANLVSDDLEERIQSIARFVEMEPALLRHWVDRRVVAFDRSGALARRITTAAEDRRKVMVLVRDLEALGAELVVTR